MLPAASTSPPSSSPPHKQISPSQAEFVDSNSLGIESSLHLLPFPEMSKSSNRTADGSAMEDSQIADSSINFLERSPDDVLILIIEELRRLREAWSAKDYNIERLSRTCKQLRSLCMPTLFRSVRVGNYRNALPVTSLLEFLKNTSSAIPTTPGSLI